MESKRRAFPRFYFVSAADLLDILSNGSTPHRIMQHMSKCFQVGVAGLGGLQRLGMQKLHGGTQRHAIHAAPWHACATPHAMFCHVMPPAC